MAPLKLYANVQGKFDVKRVVDDKVHEKVRNRTLEAERQRTERKTIMLEAPPPDLDKPTKKSKKATTTARRVVANATSSYASTSTKPAATPKESPNKAVDLSTMRSKVIHTLALGPTTAASVVRLCGSQHKEEVVSILRSVSTSCDWFQHSILNRAGAFTRSQSLCLRRKSTRAPHHFNSGSNHGVKFDPMSGQISVRNSDLECVDKLEWHSESCTSRKRTPSGVMRSRDPRARSRRQLLARRRKLVPAVLQRGMR